MLPQLFAASVESRNKKGKGKGKEKPGQGAGWASRAVAVLGAGKEFRAGNEAGGSCCQEPPPLRTIPLGRGGIRANGEQKAHSFAVEKERGEDCFGVV